MLDQQKWIIDGDKSTKRLDIIVIIISTLRELFYRVGFNFIIYDFYTYYDFNSDFDFEFYFESFS